MERFSQPHPSPHIKLPLSLPNLSPNYKVGLVDMITSLPAAAAASPPFEYIGTQLRAAHHNRSEPFTPAAIGNLAAGTKRKNHKPPRQTNKGAKDIVGKK
jgi:hypothetical protein